MTTLRLFALAALAVWVYMTCLWLLSLLRRDASLVDIFWGPGFVMLAALYAAWGAGSPVRQALLLALVSLWGLRLGVYILLRNRGKGEDFRYQKWRQQRGASFWWFSYLQVFLLQGLLMWLISTPLLAAARLPQPASLTWLDALGAGLWLLGFAFEAIGDWQLSRFKKDPLNRGRVMQTGLWRYTRHPNYFGETVLWWGYFALALAVGAWWTIFSVLLMTFLLLRVSGVTMLEAALSARPGYREYIQRTSAFFPWFPRQPRPPA